ncbi:MAG TPA: hypothetical protein VN516_07365 [Candidatus Baltobacteraceae bacterium]|nr:hypothetical protein [Candidatus Baltobacteraceae bacterium]
MFWKKRDKERERFYLLPGQGGRAYRRKQIRIVAWSLFAALLVAAIMAAVMYFMNRTSTTPGAFQ